MLSFKWLTIFLLWLLDLFLNFGLDKFLVNWLIVFNVALSLINCLGQILLGLISLLVNLSE